MVESNLDDIEPIQLVEDEAWHAVLPKRSLSRHRHPPFRSPDITRAIRYPAAVGPSETRPPVARPAMQMSNRNDESV